MIGHREQKKQQTRAALIAASHALFAKKGYQATTVADIAQAANCAPRTFFQYFSSKEDLLLIEIDEIWIDLEAALRARPAHVSTLQLLQEWATTMGEVPSEKSFISGLINEESASYLSTIARQKLYAVNKLEAILIPEFAKDLKTGVDNPEVYMLAVTAAALFDALHTDADLAKHNKLDYIKRAIRLLDGAQEAARSTKARGL